ncbi:putative alpha-xylosidase [Calycina marina]|uniref:alpha-glucosidase n=1 Tax=Calycina marina TaxID=1763456 RepID=A0A9P7ZCC0_9HELO|nr:putative alpha-xylosidase [Calycina marina]
MHHRQNFSVDPVADPSIIVGGKSGQQYRFTVLTDGLLRYEWAEDGKFEDRPSTFAINRNFSKPEFRVKDGPSSLEIITKRFHLLYNNEEFTPRGLSVTVRGAFSSHASIWRYGEGDSDELGVQGTHDMGGTARTLDESNGPIPLGPGVVSRLGFSSIDDSESMLFEGKGVASRGLGRRVDGYLFAYGHDYRDAVKALYAISGPQPLLPRWALGNWWSRYYAYRADEYLSLMDKFQEEKIPLSVAVLDMDWHLTDDERVLESGATGWTGYSWNKKLFPDPKKFLDELHDRKLKITVNDHPAEGVYSYEDAYEDIAKAVGHDTSNGDPVTFDMTDPRFSDAFFDIVHRKVEDVGVDFWWLDWQQGPHSKLRGIDPLWLLNHYTFLDGGRDNKRPLTFSRYAGPGSHRYPVGFSGDVVVSWDSLNFQPKFTATASNIGYGWWSHDIGGHMNGIRDDELATRWIQFGAFSPILRLHSSNSQWTSKEPWIFSPEAQFSMSKFLQLRHQLMPYIYTMNVKAATSGTPLLQPMYWSFPDSDEAYRVPNQYFFGTELIVMPITTPHDPKLKLGKVKGWLPAGKHVDIFSGAVYDGNRELWINRQLCDYPVFAHEGSIIPLDAAKVPSNGGENPEAFEVLIVVGTDGVFTIAEDDGTGTSVEDIKKVETHIKYTQATGTIQISPAAGHSAFETRGWSFIFLGISELDNVTFTVDGAKQSATTEKRDNGLLVKLGAISTKATTTIDIGQNPALGNTDYLALLQPFLNSAQIEFQVKERIWDVLVAGIPKSAKISRIHALDIDIILLNTVLEHLY